MGINDIFVALRLFFLCPKGLPTEGGFGLVEGLVPNGLQQATGLPTVLPTGFARRRIFL